MTTTMSRSSSERAALVDMSEYIESERKRSFPEIIVPSNVMLRVTYPTMSEIIVPTVSLMEIWLGPGISRTESLKCDRGSGARVILHAQPGMAEVRVAVLLKKCTGEWMLKKYKDCLVEMLLHKKESDTKSRHSSSFLSRLFRRRSPPKHRIIEVMSYIQFHVPHSSEIIIGLGPNGLRFLLLDPPPGTSSNLPLSNRY